MSFTHFRNRLAETGATLAEVAEGIGMSERELRMKLDELTPMTVGEARAIRDGFLPDLDLDHLLASDGDLPTMRERADAAVESFIERAFEHEEEPARSIEADELRAKSRRTDPEHVIRVIG